MDEDDQLMRDAAYEAEHENDPDPDMAAGHGTIVLAMRRTVLPLGITESRNPTGREWWENGELVPPPIGFEINEAEARALPSYTEVMATFDVTGDREFRLMARDLPRWTDNQPGVDSPQFSGGSSRDFRLSRRFTNLDTGSEVFLGGDDGMNSPGSTVNLTMIRVSAHG